MKTDRIIDQDRPRYRVRRRRQVLVRVTVLDMMLNPTVAFKVFSSYWRKVYTNWQYLHRYRMYY